MSILSSIRAMFGRGQTDPISELLIEQLDVAIEAAELTNKACTPGATPEEFKTPVKDLRSKARTMGEEIITEMSEALTVPLEREDLSRAAQGFTAITADARDMVREMVLWDLKPGSWSEDALVSATSSLSHLRDALEQDTYEDMAVHCRSAYRSATKMRVMYREKLTELFAEELTMDTLKKREVMHRADLIGRRLADLSATMLDALAKRYL